MQIFVLVFQLVYVRRILSILFKIFNLFVFGFAFTLQLQIGFL